jgi:hypothetical protein
MYDVMIHCLNTGRLVPTGVRTDEKSFEALPAIPTRLERCPACGKSHMWSKPNAILKAPERAA